MGKRGTVTLAEVLAVVALLLVAGAVFAVVLDSKRSEARRIRCRDNLIQLGRAMVAYVSIDNGVFYPWPAGRPGCGTGPSPQFGGAEWLATLYWTRIVPDPEVFNCPSSRDDNRGATDLGSLGCPGGRRLLPGAVSYAALGDASVGVQMASTMGRAVGYATSKLPIYWRAIEFPPNAPMACDDTEAPINHGRAGNGGMNVLFFDSHVEWWTHERVDLERGVGTGELVHLRN